MGKIRKIKMFTDVIEMGYNPDKSLIYRGFDVETGNLVKGANLE
jgi:hypothetical protein